MNRKKIQELTKAMVVALSVGFVVCAAAPAQAETLTGLSYTGAGSGNLFTIDSSAPGTLITSVGINGASGEAFLGIDYWGTTLYGISAGGNLWTLDPVTAAATLVGTGTFGTLNGTYYGMDATSAGVRIVSDADINMLVSYAGVLISSTPTITPTSLSLNGIASSGGTTYAVDSLANTLNIFNTALGTAASVNGLANNMGYDVSGKNGFDISSLSGIAYFASGVSSSALDANLYIVDLSSGLAGLVGTIGPGEGMLVYGLTTPIPEPSSFALAFVGGLGLLGLARRRK